MYRANRSNGRVIMTPSDLGTCKFSTTGNLARALTGETPDEATGAQATEVRRSEAAGDRVSPVYRR